MSTAVFFHAHPDDESIATGGTMAKMASEGHRVVCVTATRGELGLVPDGGLADGDTLADLREREIEKACRLLGVHRGEFLGYRDSGMAGDPTNEDADSFWMADLDEAARRLADVLDEEDADILTIYDEHGGYGHPDHIKVHTVGLRAAEVAKKTPDVYVATQNRDRVTELFAQAEELGVETPDIDDFDVDHFGVPASELTTAIDVTGFLEEKKEAMRAHASQIAETSFFLSMPDEIYAMVWGTEWYTKHGSEPTGELAGSFEETP